MFRPLALLLLAAAADAVDIDGITADCLAALGTAGCTPGTDCADCLERNRRTLQGVCWANPCPSHACFSTFRNAYCAGVPPAPPTTAEYYVSPDGNDGAPGTPEAPLLTLQRCADVAGGGRCLLRSGRYPDPVTVSAGLTLEAAPGETPILDGSAVIDKRWSREPSRQCVYRSTPYAEDEIVPWQLFLDGMVPLTPARWPNARIDDKSVFKPVIDGVGPLAYSARNSTLGELYDDGRHRPSLGGSGIDFSGCVVVLPLGVMGQNPIGAKVTAHGTGENRVTYEPPPGARMSLHPNNPYFFEGHPKLLDAEGEWSFDRDTRELLVWLPGCGDPDDAALRGKVRDYNLNVTHAQMTVRDITFYGTTFGVAGGGITLDNVTMFTPTFNKRTIWDGMGTQYTSLAIGKGFSFKMLNSRVLYNDGSSVFVRYGNNAVVQNSLFSGSCYGLGLSASLDDKKSPDILLFEGNTVEHFNCFSGITPGHHSTIRRNIFHHQGPQVDGACVHVHVPEQSSVVIEQNWFHDTTVKAARFDRVNSADAKWGTHGTIVGNVWWRTGSGFFKGDYHTVANNTAFAVSDEGRWGALVVMMYSPHVKWSIQGENEHSRIFYNAADSVYNVSGVLPATPATRGGNAFGVDVASQLTDPANFNFVPKAGSQIADAAAGAYRVGDADPWVPGCEGCDL